MKKLTALFLSLAMIFATIILTTVPVSAASADETWTLIFNEKGSSDTIEIRQQNIKQGWLYYTQVKFSVNGQEEYITKKYSKLFSFYTLKDICKIDSKLNNKLVWSCIKEIQERQIKRDAIKKVMENYTTETMNRWTKNEFNNTIREVVKGYHKDLADNAAVKALGISVPPIWEIYSEIIGNVEDTTNIFEFVMNVVDIWGYQAHKALNYGSKAENYKTYQDDIIELYTNSLCNQIKDIK